MHRCTTESCSGCKVQPLSSPEGDLGEWLGKLREGQLSEWFHQFEFVQALRRSAIHHPDMITEEIMRQVGACDDASS